MLTRIDATKFGCFDKFAWTSVRDDVGTVVDLKRLNLIYGRNYSGKTTLSRIAQCLETGLLPDKFEAPDFRVETSAGAVTHSQAPSADFCVRVYNSVFVAEHLGFLRDKDGQIKPFAVLGSDNKHVLADIALKEQALGSVADKSGLLYDAELCRANADAARVAKDDAAGAKTKALQHKANDQPNGIKWAHGIPTYNATKLQADIDKVRANGVAPLKPERKTELQALLKETPLPTVTRVPAFATKFSALATQANAALTKTIKPTAAIQELLADAVLQEWVREGIPHHRGVRDNCGFCRQKLPADHWATIDAHFNEESQQLTDLVAGCIADIAAEKTRVQGIARIQKASVYASLQPQLEAANAVFGIAATNYAASLDQLIAELGLRAKAVFAARAAVVATDHSEALRLAIDGVNAVVQLSEDKRTNLESEQKAARSELLLGDVAAFIGDISLDALEANITTTAATHNKRQQEKQAADDRVTDAQNQIAGLRLKLTDEREGANRVNTYLSSHFGHDSIRLEAVEDPASKAVSFRIMRGKAEAHNLSEGECSLVAFCYFLAKLDEPAAQGKPLIVWIDDPISSLDSSHVFFVFSLLESRLAAPVYDKATGAKTYRYAQLFVATHNLEFLKYLKRLSQPKLKVTTNGKTTEKTDVARFVVHGGPTGSSVKPMPSYLREYVTEFNYLFSEICVCADPLNAEAQYPSFYSFGNNLRKFLEAYLFFKYPATQGDSDSDYKKRVERFFGGTGSVTALVQRITNEHSHLAGLDRAAEPNDKAEIAKLAQYVLKALRDADSAQYADLLASAGYTADPVPAAPAPATGAPA